MSSSERRDQAGAEGERRPGAGDRRAGGARAVLEQVPEDALPVVVELQRVELKRLLRENDRLNTRLDQLLDELRHLREMQRREQVLRQQEQALRRQLQTLIERTSEQPALPPPGQFSGGSRPVDPPVDPRAAQAMPGPAGWAEAPSPERRPGGTAPAGPVCPRPAAPPARVASAAAAPAAPPEPLPARPAAAQSAAPRPQVEARPANPTPASAAQSGGAAPGDAAAGAAPQAPVWGQRPPPPEDAAELAGILDEIGRALRKPDASAQVEAGRRGGGAPPPFAAVWEAEEEKHEEEREPESLMEILDRIGTSAADRRNAARLMKRLFRGRGTSRHKDT